MNRRSCDTAFGEYGSLVRKGSATASGAWCNGIALAVVYSGTKSAGAASTTVRYDPDRSEALDAVLRPG